MASVGEKGLCSARTHREGHEQVSVAQLGKDHRGGKAIRYGETAMKCPNCGAENPDVVEFCQKCATRLEPIREASGGKSSRPQTRLIIAVIIICSVVILAGLVNLFYITAPHVIVITPGDVHLSYGYGSQGHDGFVEVWGNIDNSGNTDGSCTMNFTVSDSRGWSVNGSFVEVRVPAGGSTYVYYDHAWPETFNGVSIDRVNYSINPDFLVTNLTAQRA
jgi:hypothetical protein